MSLVSGRASILHASGPPRRGAAVADERGRGMGAAGCRSRTTVPCADSRRPNHVSANGRHERAQGGARTGLAACEPGRRGSVGPFSLEEEHRGDMVDSVEGRLGGLDGDDSGGYGDPDGHLRFFCLGVGPLELGVSVPSACEFALGVLERDGVQRSLGLICERRCASRNAANQRRGGLDGVQDEGICCVQGVTSLRRRRAERPGQAGAQRTVKPLLSQRESGPQDQALRAEHPRYLQKACAARPPQCP